MPRIADRIGSATGNVDPRQKAEAQLDFNASAILELLRTLYRVPHTKRPKTCWPADVRSTGGFSYWISSVPKKDNAALPSMLAGGVVYRTGPEIPPALMSQQNRCQAPVEL